MKYTDQYILEYFSNLNIPNIIPFVSDFDTLYTEHVCDLIHSNNEYAKKMITNTLEKQGYTIIPPSSTVPNVSLCEDCNKNNDFCCKN